MRLPDARQRGDVQRPHGAEAAGDGLPGAHLLPAAEAYGGRQDPQQGAGASAGKRTFLILGELLLEIGFCGRIKNILSSKQLARADFVQRPIYD